MADSMRALIVDDEPVARKVLREELELIDSVELAGEADNGASALKLIQSLKPDLVFLDVQMPAMGGFELLAQLNSGHMPAVIMVTAFDQHAIQAFEAGAVDYLLKPVSHQRLVQAVERAKRISSSPLRAAENLAQIRTLSQDGRQKVRKIVGRIGEEYFLLSPHEVLAFQAEGDTTWIITAKRRYMGTQTLHAIEQALQNSSFRRIHRNALVNVEHIRKMSTLSSQRWLVTLANGQEFIVSKRQARFVRDVLEI